MHRSFKNLSLVTSLATTLLFAAPHHASAATIVTNGTFTGTVGQIAPGGGGSATGWTAQGNEGVFGPSNTPTVFVFASNAGQTGEQGAHCAHG